MHVDESYGDKEGDVDTEGVVEVSPQPGFTNGTTFFELHKPPVICGT